MRPLGIARAGAVPHEAERPEELPGRDVERRLVDAARLPGRPAALAGEVHRPVVVEEERRVDPAEVAQPHGLGPGPRRVLRRHVEVPAAVHVRRDHVEGAVVVPDRRGVDAARRAGLLEGQLALPRQHVAQRLPVDEVAAREEWHPREELEAAVDEVEVLAHPHDTRVGVEARNDRVAVGRDPLALGGGGSGQRGREEKGCEHEHQGDEQSWRAQERHLLGRGEPTSPVARWATPRKNQARRRGGIRDRTEQGSSSIWGLEGASRPGCARLSLIWGDSIPQTPGVA